jgi:hypothetical protein
VCGWLSKDMLCGCGQRGKFDMNTNGCRRLNTRLARGSEEQTEPWVQNVVRENTERTGEAVAISTGQRVGPSLKYTEASRAWTTYV